MKRKVELTAAEWNLVLFNLDEQRRIVANFAVDDAAEIRELHDSIARQLSTREVPEVAR